MKNWLEQYNDGGPLPSNYNDSEVKLPPNFVGQGTFNGPMFTNGAVNGQFQKGGYIPPTMPDLRHPGGSDIRGFKAPIEPILSKKQVQDIIVNNKALAAQQTIRSAKKLTQAEQEVSDAKLKELAQQQGNDFVNGRYEEGFLNKMADSRLANNVWNNVVVPGAEIGAYATAIGETYQGLKSAAALGRLGLLKATGKDVVGNALNNRFLNNSRTKLVTKSIDKTLNKLGDAADYVNLDPIGMMSQQGIEKWLDPSINVKWKWNGSKYEPDFNYNGKDVGLSIADKAYNTSGLDDKLAISKNIYSTPEIIRNPIIQPWEGKSIKIDNTPFGQELSPELAPYLNSKTIVEKEAEDASKYFIPKKQMGGSIPGSVGFTYARTSGIPSKGPHRNQTYKTDASAQNGQEMSFYQHGLDWTPKMISENGSVIKDDNGYWNPDNWGKPVEINSNQITMQGVNQPLLGVSDLGDTKLMLPGENHKFKGKKVTEYPVAKNGLRQEQKGLQNLDNLLNFTNYNTPQSGGWLQKYN